VTKLQPRFETGWSQERKRKPVAEIAAKEFVMGIVDVVTFTGQVGEIALGIQPDVESNDTSIRTS
jgi:hypothetical protein